ncbi:hydrogenase maturation nickel metallochaperone HypA/HybF [Desulfobacula toluolica]|uniref:Hydrogenase maturation factor HypA n=1 Tax=Desulfobacula toluolica (strain DSM 7467 / Tol2) TaxID=651182 RepID=K0NRI3_DESTT|nr:hydrogenase maturation nickel metallochaperone HypA [Desulfobacula toluolica]CCK81537.1 HypA: hydrogenase nickel incorporation protein [Desulfobacula toluolica Tol2]
MHEMGIAQQLVKIAIDAIPEDIENPKVEILNLKIGKLASVVEHSLSFCFEIIAQNTPLATARLNIDFIPVKVLCKSCGNTWEVTGPVFKCLFCEDGDVQMLTGREIEITSLELSDE